SAFAARSPISSTPELSPDGRRIAYGVSNADVQTVRVLDVDTDEFIREVPLAGGQELQWFDWAGSDRLLVSVSLPMRVLGYDVHVTRLIVVQLSAGDVAYVGPKSVGLDGDDVIYLDPAGEFVLLSLQPGILGE